MKRAVDRDTLERLDAVIDVAEKLHRSGRSDEAIGLVKWARRLAPRHHQCRFYEAVFHAECGRTRVAIRLLRAAIRVHPRDPYMHAALSLELAREHRMEAALAHAARAASIMPKSAEFRTRHGQVLAWTGRNAAAARQFATAVSIGAGNDVVGMWGQSLYRAGQWSDAIPVLKRFLRREPHRAVQRVYLANCYAATGQIRNAKRHARMATALCPETAEDHYAAGTEFAAGGSPLAAVLHLNRSVALDRSNAAAWCNLSGAQLECGDLTAAARAARRAVALDSHDARAWCNLGDALRERGRAGEAVVCFRRAVAEDRQRVTAARERLKSTLLLARRVRDRKAR